MRSVRDPRQSAPGGEAGIHDSPLPDSLIRKTDDRPRFFVAERAGITVIRVALAALVSCCVVGCATRPAAACGGAMTVTVENDLFTGSDNNYTNGVGVTWNSNEVHTYHGEGFVHTWAGFWSFLPFVSDDGYQTYASWSLAQEMHTPDEIRDPDPPEDDQPYAGVLYLDNVLYARRDRTVHVWSFKVGVVGPASQADDMQRGFHDLIGAYEPRGWHAQLPNELLVNVGYSAAHLLAHGDVAGSASWRLVPVGTLAVGNYFTGVATGMYGEVGWNLVDALSVTALRSGFNAASTVGVGQVNGWSVSFFGGFGGYGVAHYLPLDGTVFHDSRSVDSKPFIATATIGVAVRHHCFTSSLARTFFSEMFDTERVNAQFGTLSLSWCF